MRRPGPVASKLSLHRKLVIWLLLPQLVLWLAGEVATYRLAVGYVNEIADATLLQATRGLARQVKPNNNGVLVDFPVAAQEILEADPDDRLLYMVSTPPGKFILGNAKLPLGAGLLPRAGEPYFYDGDADIVPDPTLQTSPTGSSRPVHVRIAALYIPYQDVHGKPQWMLVQVARNMSHRSNTVHAILIDTLLPFFVLIMVMTVVFHAGIGAALSPLLKLRREVDGRSAGDLAPLELDAAPEEVKGLVVALNELLASVQQSVNAQQRFIANAAHQLRTPLAGLLTQAELALTTTGADLQMRLQRVHESATRSKHIVNQLLMLARAEPESAHGLDATTVDVAQLVQEVVVSSVPRALREDIDLGIAEDDDRAKERYLTRANPLLMREAITNLVDNAIDYAGAGSEVTLQVAGTATQVKIVVFDNGPGIPSQDRARVFERFFRATHVGTGCGLGLAIVHEIVTQHGGTVVLEDAVPHGLMVTICLPRLAR